MRNRLLVQICALGLLPASSAAQSWQWVAAPTSEAASTSEITAMASDTDGTTVVTGVFSGTITLGAFTLVSSGSQNVFVARLDQYGTWRQAVRAGSPGSSCNASKLVVDKNGTAVVAGSFTGEQVSFGAFTLTSAAGFGNSGDVFVARLTRAGVWSQVVGAGGNSLDFVTALVLDNQGNVVVGGEFTSSVATFGDLRLANIRDATNGIPTGDVFIARLSAAGIWLQAVRAGGLEHDYPTDLAVEADGTLVVAGNFFSPTADFGAFQLANAGRETDVFVARLSGEGRWTQAVRAGGPAYNSISDIVLTADGTVVVAGYFAGPTTTIGTHTLLNADNRANHAEAFVARLTREGTWTQAVRAGGPGSDSAQRIALNGDGSLTVVGYFDEPAATFGTTTLTSAGNNDLFVARLSPTGTWIQARRAGGAGRDNVLGLLMRDNYLLIAGGVGSPGASFDAITIPNTNQYYSKAYVAYLGDALPERPSPVVFIPNIITPNGDGLNDAFTFSAGAPGADWSVRIYDRWGKQIYQAFPYQQDWAAHEVAAGLYYYLIEHRGGPAIKGWLEVAR